MNAYIDIYCERLDGTFWAEPINAVSNIAFIIAAILAARLVIQRNRSSGPTYRSSGLTRGSPGGDDPAVRDPRVKPEGLYLWMDTLFLSSMIGVIGVGSFLFHTVAAPWSMLADVIPIFIYKLSFLALYARRIMRLSSFRVLMLMFGFIVLGYSTYALPKDWLDGSLGYAPALIFLLGYAVYHYVTHKVERSLLFIAAGVFVVSLALRSIDMAVCDTVPIGVHYMWHILNAVVLYLTARAYILNKGVIAAKAAIP